MAQPAQPPHVAAADAAKDAPAVPVTSAPAPTLATILRARGCAPEDVTPTGCKRCLKGSDDEGMEVAQMKAELVVGPYTSPDAAEALLSYEGCSSRAAGERQYELLKPREGGGWEVIDAFGLNDVVQCAYLRGEGLVTHVFCAANSGHGDCYGVYLETLPSQGLSLDLGSKEAQASLDGDCTALTLKRLEAKDTDQDGVDELIFETDQWSHRLVRQGKVYKAR